jgi:hypothetical protein
MRCAHLFAQPLSLSGTAETRGHPIISNPVEK